MRPLAAGVALVLALAVSLAPVRAFAQDPAVEALKGRFSPPEQILIAGLLANPQTAQEFSRDGSAMDAPSFQIKWRSRLAGFSHDYEGRPHPLNEHAHSLKEAVEPAQWAMLMATLRALKKSDSWTDQAKLKIFLGMIEDADEGLKAGDARAAHKVESTANPKLADAMNEYLGSAACRDAVAEQARRDQAARDQAARDQASKDQAARDQAAKDQAAKDQAARDQAAKDRAAKDHSSKTPPVVTPPSSSEPTTPDRGSSARDQLDAANRSRGNTGSVVDGSVTRGGLPGEPTPVQVTPANGAGAAAPPVLAKPGPAPSLTVKPGVPDPSVSPDDDMAELKSMKKDAKGGWRKWAAGGIGALLGGLLGFFIGGPIGAAVGAALGGGGAFLGAKHLWG